MREHPVAELPRLGLRCRVLSAYVNAPRLPPRWASSSKVIHAIRLEKQKAGSTLAMKHTTWQRIRLRLPGSLSCLNFPCGSFVFSFWAQMLSLSSWSRSRTPPPDWLWTGISLLFDATANCPSDSHGTQIHDDITLSNLYHLRPNCSFHAWVFRSCLSGEPDVMYP